MRSVKDRDSLASHFLNTHDFDIWVTLALNSNIVNSHQDGNVLQNFMYVQTLDPTMFRRIMKFCHARYGPSMP